MKKVISKTSSIFKPLVTGVLQSVPLGNAVTKVVPAVVAMVKGKYSLLPPKEKPEWKAIFIEVIGVSVVIYSFYTHQISVDQLLDTIGFKNNG
jgi:hypothetical protein